LERFVQILSTGSYVPDRVITNQEMDEIIGEPVAQWLVENVGICERRIMSPDQTTSDLVVEAAQKALERAGVRAGALGADAHPPAVPATERAAARGHGVDRHRRRA